MNKKANPNVKTLDGLRGRPIECLKKVCDTLGIGYLTAAPSGDGLIHQVAGIPLDLKAQPESIFFSVDKSMVYFEHIDKSLVGFEHFTKINAIAGRIANKNYQVDIMVVEGEATFATFTVCSQYRTKNTIFPPRLRFVSSSIYLGNIGTSEFSVELPFSKEFPEGEQTVEVYVDIEMMASVKV